MQFKNFQLFIDQDFPTKDELIMIAEQGLKLEKEHEHDDNWYKISKSFIKDRFLWLYFEYENAKIYNDSVLDGQTDMSEKNPRKRTQVELKKQLFVCYDLKSKRLYINNLKKRSLIEYYIKKSLNCNEVNIKNIYKSLEEFEKSIETVKSLRFIQERNVVNSGKDTIFSRQINVLGLDMPNQLSIELGYGNRKLRDIKSILNKLKKGIELGSFSNVLVVGETDKKIEESFDFSSIIKYIEMKASKKDNGMYDENVIKEELLNKLRREDV